MSKFADVILPVPLNRYFTYSIPYSLEHLVVPGVRLYVPFGKNRRMTAITVRTHEEKPSGYSVKEVLSVLDQSFPSFLPQQMKLFSWLSDYYLCSPGEVMKAALPVGLRPDNNSKRHAFKPKTELFVRLGHNPDLRNDTCPEQLFGNTAKARKELFIKYLELSGMNIHPESPKPVSKLTLSEFCKSSSVIQSLVDKDILEYYEVETGRLQPFIGSTTKPNNLSPIQQKAIDEIHTSFSNKNVCLLHGITSCGKTEIYIHLIKEQIDRGKQVLYLLPEIALTSQIMLRLQSVFGNDMTVYHSRCSENVRAEIWNHQTGPEPYKLVLGARSAVMLPFKNLGLIIVDEEHEPSFKQDEPAPRYHGRNTAIMLASFSQAKTLLGSATPSFESYHNALTGKYGLVTISQRFRETRLPTPLIVDVAEMMRKKYMKGIMSPQLIEKIAQALDNRKQVILFQNRRGYSDTVECPDCGWVQKCDRCDVSLTFHKENGMAVCHYCGHKYLIPASCPSCGGKTLRGRGYGTERIEETIKNLFPQARTSRLDLDSAKNGYETILSDFQKGRTDILVGTQMISKGLDFENVNVVGILQADSILSYPDFRATERAYQLIMQVAGRAGRKESGAVVVIQTRQPDAKILNMLRFDDWKEFYSEQIVERKLFNYPPFSRLVMVTLKSQSLDKVEKTSALMAEKLTGLFGKEMVLGPDAPAISRIQSRHIRTILVKNPAEIPVRQTRALLLQAAEELKVYGELLNGVTLSFDADPQ
ncbi:MAG: primosomal protein N' [Bacteroidaceae bacterium]|nr:primosomal protein N' [Bacteroidaceae bacterium]